MKTFSKGVTFGENLLSYKIGFFVFPTFFYLGSREGDITLRG